MRDLRSKVIYHGGSIPVPSYLQKGTIHLEKEVIRFQAKAHDPRYHINMTIPVQRIKEVSSEERKYYSSVGYFLIIEYINEQGKEEELELEIRSFLRRGRALALSRLWAETLSERKDSFI